ncbi:MAG: hypothetical protein IPO15_14145 [Anaerolineae bacterium]|uniref:hypothetical protein n=1 Tax=Candidatus Amarolinea dominans TaxID=3140696 RepID=UPI003136CAEA|nr:hypothetical protein [Anaerolineae bacterium]
MVDAVVSPTPTALTLPTLTPTPEPATTTPHLACPYQEADAATDTHRAAQPSHHAAHCRAAVVRILVLASRPGDEIVSGTVQIVGSAEAERSDYYKIDPKPGGAGGRSNLHCLPATARAHGVLGS